MKDHMVDVDDYPGCELDGCPTCGAEPGQQCTLIDPGDSLHGAETACHVHVERVRADIARMDELYVFVTYIPPDAGDGP